MLRIWHLSPWQVVFRTVHVSKVLLHIGEASSDDRPPAKDPRRIGRQDPGHRDGRTETPFPRAIFCRHHRLMTENSVLRFVEMKT